MSQEEVSDVVMTEDPVPDEKVVDEVTSYATVTAKKWVLQKKSSGERGKRARTSGSIEIEQFPPVFPVADVLIPSQDHPLESSGSESVFAKATVVCDDGWLTCCTNYDEEVEIRRRRRRSFSSWMNIFASYIWFLSCNKIHFQIIFDLDLDFD